MDAGLVKFVRDVVAAVGIAVLVYFLDPWLWIPSVPEHGLFSTVLTTLVVVITLGVLNPTNYGIPIKWPWRH